MDKSQCPICLEEIIKKITLECCHDLCKNCFEKVDKCPLCRTNIKKTNTISNITQIRSPITTIPNIVIDTNNKIRTEENYINADANIHSETLVYQIQFQLPYTHNLIHIVNIDIEALNKIDYSDCIYISHSGMSYNYPRYGLLNKCNIKIALARTHDFSIFNIKYNLRKLGDNLNHQDNFNQNQIREYMYKTQNMLQMNIIYRVTELLA